MFHSVSLLSQAPLARGSRALPSVLFNRVMQLGPEDQASMLEVISDCFTSPSLESDESLDSDSDDSPGVDENMPVIPDVDEDMPVTISMHTEGKISYYNNYYYKKHKQ